MRSDWQVKKLSDIVEFNPTERLPKGAIAKKISMDMLQPFTKDIFQYELQPYTGGAKFRNGDTIMARITPCLENGKVSKVNILTQGEVGFGSTEYIVLRAIPNVSDPDFIYYLTISDFVRAPAIKSMVGSSGRQRVQQNVLETLELPIPPYDEQKKIAAILSALDEKIATNRAINDNLLEQMQAIYKSWFVDYLPFGGVMPESWTKTGIYSLANIIYGAPFASKQFNTEGHGKPIIRIRDLKDQQFATYTTEVHPKGYLLRPGDIVVGMDGEFRPYIWGNDEAWLNQRVCVFENKRPKGKAFLYFTIKPLLYAIEQTQVATTVIHIGKKDYDAFEIMLPDAATLDSFDSLTAPMIMQIVSNSFENKRLAVMRDALLPKLMSGEIDVSAVQL